MAPRIMTDEQRRELLERSRARRAGTPRPVGPAPESAPPPAPQHPFAHSDTQVIAIASGKGGVGKSTITANLAAALAHDLAVGVIDADIHGFAIPRMLGALAQPTRDGDHLVPPVSFGVKVVSIGMFTPPGQPVIWRGPVMHRAFTQFLTDFDWGDLDVLLLDLPPGTGEMALSVAQLLPQTQLVVVTTPQAAAAEVAERAGAVAAHTHQRVLGVIENMSWLPQADGSRLEVFGAGGGARVAHRLSTTLALEIPLLGQVPLDARLRECADDGVPAVLAVPDAPGAAALIAIAARLRAGLPVRSSATTG